jgi:hypothetical protein
LQVLVSLLVPVWRFLSLKFNFCFAVRSYLFDGIENGQVFVSVGVPFFNLFFIMLFSAVCPLPCPVLHNASPPANR